MQKNRRTEGRRKKRIIPCIILLVGMVLVFSLGSMQIQGDDPLTERLSTLRDIFYIINHYYVEEVEIGDLFDGAIRGMMRTLDPYSSFLPQEEYDEMQVQIKGEYGGIGIIITLREDELTIVSPFTGTPADKEGLEAGDIIKKVNGENTQGWSLEKAVSRIRGEEGTPVNLTIKRPSREEAVFEVVVTRAIIQIPFIEAEILEEGMGYINLLQFGEDVGYELQDTIQDLLSQGAQGMILDLRNNPGGLLSEAVSVASNFIQEQPIVHIEQRGEKLKTYHAVRGISAQDYPLVVLVNKGSASASEIVAAAIKDNHRGTLVGVSTFGKGTVQTVVPMEDGSAIRITTARYLTSQGNKISDEGLMPHIVVEWDGEEEADVQLKKAIQILKEELEEVALLPAVR